MAYELCMFCKVDPAEVRIFGETVCSSVARARDGVEYRQVSLGTESSEYEIRDIQMGEMVEVSFYWSGQFFDHQIAMASGEAGGDAIKDCNCIVDLVLVETAPWPIISAIWEIVFVRYSGVLYDGFGASIG